MAGPARICRILSSKTVCRRLVECNRLKIRAVQTVTGERPAFMALPAEHASSHQASMLAAGHESTVVSLIREGSSVDRANLILSYVCMYVCMYGQG